MLRPPAEPRPAAADRVPAVARGVAVAAAFDWALAAMAPAALVLTLARGRATDTLLAAFGLIAVLVAPPLIALGEGVRRGLPRARALQIGLVAVLLLINAAGVIRDLVLLLRGDIPRSVSLPALLIDLYIVWGLTRPETIRWFDTAATGAHRRRGNPWPLPLAFTGILGGVAAALLNGF